jgi:hypothetical protein
MWCLLVGIGLIFAVIVWRDEKRHQTAH